MTDIEVYEKCHEQFKTLVTTDGMKYTGRMYVTTDAEAQEDNLEEGYVWIRIDVQIPISRIADVI